MMIFLQKKLLKVSKMIKINFENYYEENVTISQLYDNHKTLLNYFEVQPLEETYQII